MQISVPGAQEIVDWWNAGRCRHRRRVAALGVALLVALLTIIVAVHSDHHALAAVGEDRERLIAEAADLIYHFLVLLEARGVALAEVEALLGERTAQSGLEEKTSRPRANG